MARRKINTDQREQIIDILVDHIGTETERDLRLKCKSQGGYTRTLNWHRSKMINLVALADSLAIFFEDLK
jgi:hypothetical protein